MDYSNIPPKELSLLAYYAYSGNADTYASMASFKQIFGFSNGAVDTLQKKLRQKGLIKGGGYYSYMLEPAHRIPVLVYIIKQRRNILDLLNGVNYSWGSNPGLFVQCIEAALEGKTLPMRSHYGMDFVPYFTALDFTQDWASRLLFYLDDEAREELVRSTIELNCSADVEVPKVLFEKCANLTVNTTCKHNIEDMEVYYNYLSKGIFTMPSKISAKRPWQHVLLGVRAVHEGRYAEALQIFERANQAYPKKYRFDEGVGDMFADYYQMVAILHLSDTSALADTSLRAHYRYKLPAYVVKSAILADNNEPSATILDNLKEVKEPMFDSFYELFIRYFKNTDLGKHPAKPKMRVMQYEMQKYLLFTPAELESLQQQFSATPGLTSAKRMKKWEWDIKEMMGCLDRQERSETAAAPAQKPQQKISYFIDERQRVVPMLQKWLEKSDRWSVGYKVSIPKFYEGEYELGDPLNRKFAKLIERSYYDYSLPSLSVAATLFVDNPGRLFSSLTLANPVEIKEGKPWVELKKTDQSIMVKSNISLRDLGRISANKSSSLIVKETLYLYNYYKISDAQEAILTKLLTVGSFPLEAEQLLTLFLAKLDGVIEVRSSLLSEESVPITEASSTIVAQMTRANVGNYVAALRVRPQAQGRACVMPGAGRRTMLMQNDDGLPVRVRRNFDKERQALEAVVDFAEGLEGVEAEYNEDDSTLMLPIDGVLQLMGYSKEHPEELAIEWPVGQALRIKQASGSSGWNVGLKSNHGWFDLEGDVRIDDATVISMSALLDMVSQSKGQFVRMGENEYVQIDRKLRRQLERLESLAVRNRNKLQISGFNAALLDEATLNGEFAISYDKSLVELQQRIRESESLVAEVPRTLQATLRPYQEEGFQWMARLASWGAGACLADDMGLGKTVQTIAFLLYKASEGAALVVAPASVVPNWERELERFAPSLKVTLLNKADDRAAAIKAAKKGHVVICTYGLLNTEEEALCKKKWATICLDEAHTIKNKETKMSQAAMKLQAQYRIILTGTPIQNHLGELWNLFRFINPGLLGSFENFRTKYVKPITEENDKGRRKALKSIIKPFMLRRTKVEVIDDLPDKTEIYMPVELADDEMAMYEAMRQRAAKAIEGQEKVDINTLAEITRLRQAACSMQLVDGSWAGSDSKIQAFMDLVRDFKGDGHNGMLVFSQFTSFLALVRQALDKADEPYLYLDGSTPIKKRQELVEDFSQGKCPIFIISLKAGGLGLNLPHANYVVHLDPWWNPAIEQQATDRAYRIGQKRNVTVYHLLAKGTIEDKIRRLHSTKRDLADSLLEGTDLAGRLTMADVLELIQS